MPVTAAEFPNGIIANIREANGYHTGSVLYGAYRELSFVSFISVCCFSSFLCLQLFGDSLFLSDQMILIFFYLIFC